MRLRKLALLAAVLPTFVFAATNDVTRATLPNGLRVIIVRDPLAPVVTVEENYLAGGDETPAGFPGTAHAQEHMEFRGCKGLTAEQIAAIYAQLGGYNNADTQQTITQYFATIPAQDLDLALRVDSSCMSGVEDSQSQWDQERGAIEQEVSRDLSNPTYKLVARLNKDLFAGTPYEQDALGTKESFDKTTAVELKEYWNKWYGPNNAILVITGDVNAQETLEKVRQYYGDIPRKDIPAHPAIDLQPVKNETFTLDSNLPYILTAVAYRFPGTDSPDFAAAQVLSDVLSSQRGNLFTLIAEGKALYAGFQMFESYPKASAGLILGAIPPNADAAALDSEMLRIVKEYANNGVPADLVQAAKRSRVANAEFERNSITNLASLWSEAVASEGRQSPDEDVEAIKKVTLDDVNRVAKKYLVTDNYITATLKPVPSGGPVSAKGFGGSEQTVAPPTTNPTLPAWAESAVKSLAVPKTVTHPEDVKLPNGIRLIVETQRTSPTVTLVGSIKMQAELETPPGKDGVYSVLDDLFSYGTKTLDRIAFQKALDDIAANENAGASFNLKVLKQNFDRGVQLLADNELNPALPESQFKIVQQQAAQEAEGVLQSPEYKMNRAVISAILPPSDPLQREVTPKTISSIQYSDLLGYYSKAFRPDLTTIVLIGDITMAEARPVIEKYFGQWKADGAKPDVVLPAVPENKASATNVPDPAQIQDTVELTEVVPMNRFTPEYYAFEVGDHVLGGGFYATRLYRDVRQKAGYVYNINNTLDAEETRADYTIEYGCDPDKVSKARTLIEQELRAMQTQNVSDWELQQAKALLLRQIQLRESSEDAIAAGIIARARIGLPLDEPHRAAEKYYATTAEQVRAAFSKYLDLNNLVQVVRGPAPQ